MGRRNPFDIKAEYETNMGQTIGLWEERPENHFLGENIATRGMRVIYVKEDTPVTKPSETPKAPLTPNYNSKQPQIIIRRRKK